MWASVLAIAAWVITWFRREPDEQKLGTLEQRTQDAYNQLKEVKDAQRITQDNANISDAQLDSRLLPFRRD